MARSRVRDPLPRAHPAPASRLSPPLARPVFALASLLLRPIALASLLLLLLTTHHSAHITTTSTATAHPPSPPSPHYYDAHRQLPHNYARAAPFLHSPFLRPHLPRWSRASSLCFTHHIIAPSLPLPCPSLRCSLLPPPPSRVAPLQFYSQPPSKPCPPPLPPPFTSATLALAEHCAAQLLRPQEFWRTPLGMAVNNI
jgi:hypothetical protein